MNKVLKRGVRFRHAQILNLDNTPALYVITKVAQGDVYYRPVDGGGSLYEDVKTFLECRVLAFEEDHAN